VEENLKVKMKTKAGNVKTKRECRRRAQNRIREKQEKKIKQRQDLSRGLACYGLPW